MQDKDLITITNKVNKVFQSKKFAELLNFPISNMELRGFDSAHKHDEVVRTKTIKS